ncbi:MAG: hypothetical protein V1679_02265 [Candidatus Peregrinibacteria bacterium]
MTGLNINIGWEYFLVIIGALIAIAWYAGSRFAKIDEAIKWIKTAINDLKTTSDNEKTPAFDSQSPVNLNSRGEEWLRESGLKEYIDSHKDNFMRTCEDKKDHNPYDIQQYIFSYFDNVELEPKIDKKLKEFAFQKGTTMNIIRRVAGIYFRNLCLQEFGMAVDDIDKHKPSTKT